MPLNLNLDSIKKELTVSSVKDRASKLNDRYSSPSSSSTSTSYNRPVVASPSSSDAARVLPPPDSSARSASSANRVIASPAAAAPLPPRRTGPTIRQQQQPELEEDVEYSSNASDHKARSLDWQNIPSRDKRALFSMLDQVRILL